MPSPSVAFATPTPPPAEQRPREGSAPRRANSAAYPPPSITTTNEDDNEAPPVQRSSSTPNPRNSSGGRPNTLSPANHHSSGADDDGGSNAATTPTTGALSPSRSVALGSISIATRSHPGTSASATFLSSAATLHGGAAGSSHGGTPRSTSVGIHSQQRLRPRPLLRRWYDALVDAAHADAATIAAGAVGNPPAGADGNTAANAPLSPFDAAYEEAMATVSAAEARAALIVASLRRAVAPPATAPALDEADSLSNSTTAPVVNGSTASAFSPARWRNDTCAPGDLAQSHESQSTASPSEAAGARTAAEAPPPAASGSADHAATSPLSGSGSAPTITHATVPSPASAGTANPVETFELRRLRRENEALRADVTATGRALEALVSALLQADTAAPRFGNSPALTAALEAVEHRQQLGAMASPPGLMPEPSTGELIPASSASYGFMRYGPSGSFSASNPRSGVSASVAVRAALAGIRGTISPTNSGYPHTAGGSSRGTPMNHPHAAKRRASVAPLSAPPDGGSPPMLAAMPRDTPDVVDVAAAAVGPNTAASGSYETTHGGDMFDASHASIKSLTNVAAARTTVTANVTDTFDDGTQELNQFVLLQPLGAGSQGEVFLALDTEKNEMRAVKAVRRPAAPPASGVPHGPLAAARHRKRAMLEREVAVMKKCRHRNVVALYEVIDDPAVECMYLVMQYVEHGPLRTMQPGGLIIEPINPVRLAGYARQLCAGLEYLHRHGVIHRDIKPENILLGEDDQVFLADFGVADLFDGGDGADASGICGTRGTFPFLAPELFEDDHDDAPAPRENGAKPTGEQRLAAAAALAATTTATNSTITSDHGLAAQQAAAQRLVRGEAVDVWALGVTLYVLLYGSLPWRYTTTHELVEAIVRGPITFPDLPPPPGAAAAADDDDDAATQPPSSTKKDRRRSTAVFVTSHSPSESTEASPLPAAAAAVAASSAAGQASPEALPPPLAPPGDVSHGSDDGLNSASVSLGCGRSTMLPQPSLATAAAPSDVESGSEHTASPSRNRSRRQSLTQTDSTLGVSSGQWALESPGLTASVHISGAAEETDLRSPWKSLLRGMLERDPSRRLTISQARARAMRMLRTASKRAERLEQEAPTPAAITRIVRRPSMASLSLLHQQQQQQQQQLQTE